VRCVVFLSPSSRCQVSRLNYAMRSYLYRGADKSLVQPGRKQTTVTEDFYVHISYL